MVFHLLALQGTTVRSAALSSDMSTCSMLSANCLPMLVRFLRQGSARERPSPTDQHAVQCKPELPALHWLAQAVDALFST